MCFSPQRRAIFWHQNFKKFSEDLQFFNICTSKCAFRHSGLQFFDIRTSKSAPTPSVFLTFSLPNVLFATAACNFFRHQNFKKCSEDYSFSTFVCRVSPKVGLLKRRVRRSVLRGEVKNCTPLWRKTHLEVKMLKNWRCRSTFWSSDVEKLQAAVAKSTFGCENVEKLTVSEHFLKFWCRKIACRCGEKHIL